MLPLLSAVAAVVVSLMLPPVYEAQATVLVRPAQPINSLDPSTNTVSTTADQVAATYSQLMTQRTLVVHRKQPVVAQKQRAER